MERQRHGKKEIGPLGAIFLPLAGMKAKYPYLERYPFLLPAAWIQRVVHYMSHRGENTDPALSMRIGKERTELLRIYGIID